MEAKLEQRLDANESFFFARQLEHIDPTIYKVEYAGLNARKFFRTILGVPEDAPFYTYGMFDHTGEAEWIFDHSKALPRVDVNGAQKQQVIRKLGDSFGYTLSEIKTASRLQVPLDASRANAAMRVAQEKIDRALSIGDSVAGVTGALKIASGTTTFTPGNKAASGTAAWGTITAPVATGDEVYADLVGICAAIINAVKGHDRWQKFRILLPVASYNYAAWVRMGLDSPTTALQAALNHPNIQAIDSWHRCDTASGSGGTRMMAYADDVDVIGALVPMEAQRLPPVLGPSGLEYVVPVVGACGGIVSKYPLAVAYGDSI